MIPSDPSYTASSVKAVFQRHPAVRGDSRAGRAREGKEAARGRGVHQTWWVEKRERCGGESQDSEGTGGGGQGLCVGRERKKGECEGGTGR